MRNEVKTNKNNIKNEVNSISILDQVQSKDFLTLFFYVSILFYA